MAKRIDCPIQSFNYSNEWRKSHNMVVLELTVCDNVPFGIPPIFNSDIHDKIYKSIDECVYENMVYSREK